MRFDTRQIRDVAHIQNTVSLDTPSLDVSPNGRYLLLYSPIDSAGADLMLVDRW